ncbi:MAG TPA: MotA/TolQ/ExbB proton channel family protein [Pirellulales bacterium]|nr:MotA/TolQ/ExbB proton channel family protein [Pirellulales bacterium]
MFSQKNCRRPHTLALLLAMIGAGSFPISVLAQADEPPRSEATADKLREAEQRFEDAMKPADEKAGPKDPAETAPPKITSKPPNLLELWMMGGPLMIPITFMSFVVVVFAVERGLALRRRRVVPPAFIAALTELAERPSGFDPQQAYQLCQQYPSTAANVVRAVLLKVGRPASELEQTRKETSEREAARLYKNIRPIALAVSITPLLGLLGTVQGMIECFYKTANLAASANKTQELANGIYVALVTTFGGLVVAIPAAVLAHYFEGRIQAHFFEIDELFVVLSPRLEAFEGKGRLSSTTAS